MKRPPVDTDFDVDVHVPLKATQYRALNRLSRETKLSVPALVRECVRRQLEVPEQQQRRPLTVEEMQHIRARHEEGARIAHMAFELGRPTSVVSRAMARAGLKAHHGRGRPTNTERRA